MFAYQKGSVATWGCLLSASGRNGTAKRLLFASGNLPAELGRCLRISIGKENSFAPPKQFKIEANHSLRRLLMIVSKPNLQNIKKSSEAGLMS